MQLGENTFANGRSAGSASPAEGPKSAASTRDFDPDALTRALRIAGAALVVASASTFMLQHWDGGDDIMRYGMLVGQSLLLAAAAYFVGLSLREGRSARTFLALVLATMPVSFAVLGGLVYSQFHWESAMAVPTYATWVAPSKLAALVALASTLVLFVPLALVSFTALARQGAKTLSLAFFAGNLAVLVPVRSPLVIVLLVAALVTALLRLELKRFAQGGQLDTLEGKLARGLLFAPPVLMLGRVFHLYHPGATFIGGVLLIVASASFQLLGRTQRAGLRDLGSWVVGLTASLGWALCWPEVAAALGDSRAAAILSLGLPISLLLGVAGQRAAGARRSLLAAATFTAPFTAVVACVAELDSLAAIGCIVVGVSIAVWGASVRAMVRTLAGTVVALFGLGVQVWLATHADNVLRWASLSAVGMLLIVGSAYVERNRSRVARFWAEARARRELSQDAA